MHGDKNQPRGAAYGSVMVLIGLVGAAAVIWWAGGLFQEAVPVQSELGSGEPETTVSSSSPLVVRVSEDGPCAIAGEAKGADSHPVYLTALRYERRGAIWVVSDFVNVDLGSKRAFVIDGLIPGRWFVAARGFVAEEPAWGRSEAIVLSADEPWSRTGVSLESFQVHAVVEGLPEELADEVYLSMDWEERDRVQVEADEFLDLPNDVCPRTDAFQIFGSLQSVGPIWMAQDAEADGAAPSFAPLNPEEDPWGRRGSHRSWITPAPTGPLPLVLPGPGTVRVTLHGLPGVWDSEEQSVDLVRGAAIKVLRFKIDDAALASRVPSF